MCGSPHFLPSGPRSRCCRDCGFEYFLNAAAAVAIVLPDGRGNLLVSRRGRPPREGMLDLPGGFVDPDETMEEAIRREMLEETSLHVTPERWLFSLPNRYEYGGISIPTADNFFLCSAHDLTPLCPHDDVASLLWLPLASLDADQFGLQSMRRAVPMIRQVLL